MKSERSKRVITWILLAVMLLGAVPYDVFAGNGADLASFLEEVKITDAKGSEVPEDQDGRLKIEKGDTYKLSMTFSETQDHQFPDEGDMTYTIPQGLEMVGGVQRPLTSKLPTPEKAECLKQLKLKIIHTRLKMEF